jgi:hypothetical protein
MMTTENKAERVRTIAMIDADDRRWLEERAAELTQEMRIPVSVGAMVRRAVAALREAQV